MKRIAVLVSGGGTNLQALIDAMGRGEIPEGEFAAVISSSPDAFALKRAEGAGIPTFVIDRKAYTSNREMTVALTGLLQAQRIDLVVLAGFMYILTGELVEAYPNAIINIHPALIPSFCGAGCYGLHVHEAALAYGVKVTCIMWTAAWIQDPSSCRRRCRWRRGTPRRPSSAGLWSRRSGFCCPGRWICSAGTSCPWRAAGFTFCPRPEAELRNGSS